MCEPVGRRPGRALPYRPREISIAPNGRLPATLPEPIKRARDKDLRGFAGEGNVVERSERYASVAKPEGPRDKKARARAGLLGAGIIPNLDHFSSIAPDARRARHDC